ncbi:hypothetical protein HK099_006241 [Clydaea vesicula]|uniref:Uncharacterized protein n=1 Tax=Clydaea vesicula TaxID=447962 RepID=A0AAD5U052_9FUNG|nr:hypothetical protein HK099_006241 [Clydaea vesicula]
MTCSKASGNISVKQACGSDETCSNGKCNCKEVGSTKCTSQSIVATCSTGSGWTSQNCPTGTTCSGNDATSGLGGKCKCTKSVCTANGSLQTCSNGVLNAATTCEAGKTCITASDGSGSCKCTENTCDSNGNFVPCKEDGTFGPATPCDKDFTCTLSGGKRATCNCVPNKRRCSKSGNAVEGCRADGSYFDSTSCELAWVFGFKLQNTGGPAAFWAQIYVDGKLFDETGKVGNKFLLSETEPANKWNTDPNYDPQLELQKPTWTSGLTNLNGCPVTPVNKDLSWGAYQAQWYMNGKVVAPPAGIWLQDCKETSYNSYYNWARYILTASALNKISAGSHEIILNVAADNIFTIYLPDGTSETKSNWVNVYTYQVTLDPSTSSASCNNGICQSGCSPAGGSKCTDSTHVSTCAVGNVNWSPPSLCPTGTQCIGGDAKTGLGGTCKCTKNFCVNGQLQMCNSDGSFGALSSCGEKNCVASGNDASDQCKCVNPKCNESGQLIQCNSDGNFGTAKSCDAGFTCSIKSSKPAACLCDPSAKPKCDGNTVLTCKSDGTGYEKKPCSPSWVFAIEAYNYIYPQNSAGNPGAFWARIYVDDVLVDETGKVGNNFLVTNVQPDSTWKTDPTFSTVNWKSGLNAQNGCPVSSNPVTLPWGKSQDQWYDTKGAKVASPAGEFVLSSVAAGTHKVDIMLSVDNYYTIYLPNGKTYSKYADLAGATKYNWQIIDTYTMYIDAAASKSTCSDGSCICGGTLTCIAESTKCNPDKSDSLLTCQNGNSWITSDCPVGNTCKEGKCVCKTPGDSCSEDNSSVVSCDNNTGKLTKKQCGSDQTCSNGKCVCSPAGYKCKDDFSSVSCDGKAESWSAPKTCDTGKVCDSTTPLAGQCKCKTNQCEGQKIRTCNSDGTFSTAVACPTSGDTCQGGNNALIPGKCRCAEGATKCGGDGVTVLRCSCDGIWETSKTCSSGYTCTSGQCTCSGGSKCVNGESTKEYSCVAGIDLDWKPKDCSVGTTCLGNGSNGLGGSCKCTHDQCVGDKLQRCNKSSGVFETASTCPNHSDNTPVKCSGGDSSTDAVCKCAPVGTKCDTGGASWTTSTCPSGKKCSGDINGLGGNCDGGVCTQDTCDGENALTSRSLPQKYVLTTLSVKEVVQQQIRQNANVQRIVKSVEACKSDGTAWVVASEQCAADQTCNLGSCVCSPAGSTRCNSNTEVGTCVAGNVNWGKTACDDGKKCITTDLGGSCKCVQDKCDASGKIVKCQGDGNYGTAMSCEAGFSCKGDGTANNPATCKCTAGATRCDVTNKIVETCNSAGNAFVSTSCNADQLCSKGVCVCDKEGSKCINLETQAVCKSGKSNWESQKCKIGEQCTGDSNGYGGKCNCTKDKCLGVKIQVCTIDVSGIGSIGEPKECGPYLQCTSTADGDRCRCNPGETHCYNGYQYTCDASGLISNPVNCPTGTSCLTNDVNTGFGSCKCTKNFCDGSGKLHVCNSDGTLSITSCADDKVCQNEIDGSGTCKCTKDKCVQNGGAVAKCNSGGDFDQPSECAVGFACAYDPSHPATCKCKPGDKRCAYDNSEKCDADGNRFSVTSCPKSWLFAFELFNEENVAAFWAQIYVDDVLLDYTGNKGSKFGITATKPEDSWMKDPSFSTASWHYGLYNLENCPKSPIDPSQPWGSNQDAWGTNSPPPGIWYPSCTYDAKYTQNWARYLLTTDQISSGDHEVKLKVSVDNHYKLYLPDGTVQIKPSDKGLLKYNWQIVDTYIINVHNGNDAGSPPLCENGNCLSASTVSCISGKTKCSPDVIDGVMTCSNQNVWVASSTCPAGKKCDNGKCVCKNPGKSCVTSGIIKY